MTANALLRGVVAAAAISLCPPLASAQDDVDISDHLAACNGCHGEDGRPIQEAYPILWGQEFYYLYVQLRDYAAGRRQHEIMSDIASGLSKDEMKALAMHFSKQPWPRIPFKASDDAISAGRKAAAEGQCSQCHLDGYLGNSRVPRTAGQTVSYLEQTMLDMKYDRRQNAAAMSSLMESYSDAAIRAMAELQASR